MLKYLHFLLIYFQNTYKTNDIPIALSCTLLFRADYHMENIVLTQQSVSIAIVSMLALDQSTALP